MCITGKWDFCVNSRFMDSGNFPFYSSSPLEVNLYNTVYCWMVAALCLVVLIGSVKGFFFFSLLNCLFVVSLYVVAK